MQSQKRMSLAVLSAALLAQTAGAADLFNNGGIATGAVTGNGVAALPGTVWSELQNDGAGTANGSTGSTCSSPTFRLADNFTVPAGGWTIREIAVYGYQTGNLYQVINSLNIQIWNGPPNAGGVVIFGDTITNRLNSVAESNIIRTFSTTVPAVVGPSIQRRPAEFRALIESAPGVGLTLPAGNYWIDFQLTQAAGPAAVAIFCPAVTVVGARNRPGDNALQSNAGVWAAALDGGNPTAGPDVPLDFPFVIRNTVSPAPSNCSQDINGDGSVGVADLLAVIGAWGACP